MRITDFDRGLGYGLLVAVACSVGTYWLGQDDADRPIVSIVVTPDGYDVRSITPLNEGESVDDAVDSIVTERIDAAGCEYNGQAWTCTDGLHWLAGELNTTADPNKPVEHDADTIAADIEASTDGIIMCSDTDGDGEAACNVPEGW